MIWKGGTHAPLKPWQGVQGQRPGHTPPMLRFEILTNSRILPSYMSKTRPGTIHGLLFNFDRELMRYHGYALLLFTGNLPGIALPFNHDSDGGILTISIHGL